MARNSFRIVVRPSKDLRIEVSPDGTALIEVFAEGVRPEEMFKEAVLRDRDPLVAAAVGRFLDTMTDAAIIDGLNNHRVID